MKKSRRSPVIKWQSRQINGCFSFCRQFFVFHFGKLNTKIIFFTDASGAY